MRKLIYAAVSLAIAVSVSADCASARTKSTPHIDGAVQFPQTRSRIVRHTIRLHIPQGSSPLSQLTIDVPEGLRANNNITINKNSGESTNADVAITGNQVMVNFPQPITPDSKLEIILHNVKIRGTSNAWTYQVTAKFVGIDANIPLGLARIRIY
ncbi:DUF2808 domain-containing protein [Microcoleus sp. F4-D5]|uniref:DUF2808 domain-containing protein n=1 Tax=Microcoleus sp. F4-D5 TaxID=2818760 RepID=UPI002FD4F5C1